MSDDMTAKRVYVASSWRNNYYSEVVAVLKSYEILDVYDFRDEGFSWRSAGVDGEAEYGAKDMREILRRDICLSGFERDLTHLHTADITILVLPAGRSAHLELGYAAGKGQFTLIYMPTPQQPDLMWNVAHTIVGTIPELLTAMNLPLVR